MPKPLLVTDEWPDRVFGRPLGRLLVWLLLKTPVTANQVTWVAGVCGLACGVFLAVGDGCLFAIVMAAYLVLDCTDGQLARAGRGSGALGRLADGVSDYLTATSSHVGWIVWISRLHGLVEGLLWGVGAGLSMAWSSFLLDRYKRRYKDDPDDPEQLRAAGEAAGGLWIWVAWLFVPYARGTNARVSNLEAYRESVRLPMRLWLLGGPTHHFVTMAVCAWFEEPRLYALIACVPFNLLTIATLAVQHDAQRRVKAVPG